MRPAAERDFWSNLPLGPSVAVIARDANGLAALSKPAGVLSHPNEPGEEGRSLLRAAYDEKSECYAWEGGRLWLLNRLDSATSGVIVVADRGDLAAAVREQFRKHRVRKVYHAMVFGAPRRPSELWRDRMTVRRGGGRIRAFASGGAKAESRMSAVKMATGETRLSLLRLEPLTGRTHQLRVQCAKRGLPIVGDQTYGDFRSNREFSRDNGIERLFLHSHEISFPYEYAGAEHRFYARAPLPPEFERFFRPAAK